jgi:hypothetical protein
MRRALRFGLFLLLVCLLIFSLKHTSMAQEGGDGANVDRGGDADVDRGGDADVDRGGDADVDRGGDTDVNRGGDTDVNRGGDTDVNRGIPLSSADKVKVGDPGPSIFGHPTAIDRGGDDSYTLRGTGSWSPSVSVKSTDPSREQPNGTQQGTIGVTHSF